MNEETPSYPPSTEALPAPPPAPLHRRPGARRWVGHWLGELATVFIGVYGAFLLGNHVSHRQEQQRRAQLLTWVEEHYSGVRDNAREVLAKLREVAEPFDRKVAAGEMPEVKPISWEGDYDAADSTSVLQSGGYDLLDIETIRDMRDVESTLRQLVGRAIHAQQVSDSLILPNRGKDPSVFYDPATRQLREPYAWIPKFHRDLVEAFMDLQSTSEKLLVQVRADRARGR